jgi:hypothetical protein
VSIACLESRKDMPATRREVEQAEQEGIVIYPSRTFTKILSRAGRATGVECLNLRSMRFDKEGELHIDAVQGSEHTLKGDMVILAIGQKPDIDLLSGISGIEITKRGTIAVDPETLETGHPGVFAGGDAVTAGHIIDAIAAGRKAASWIDQYLGGLGIIDEVLAPPEEVPELSPAQQALLSAGGDPKRPQLPLLAVEQRLAGFDEVELGLSEQTALVETTRCLKCDQMGFDCGACGFKTCREAVISCQNRLNETGGEPWGWLVKGPSCIWRLVELGIAIDWAAAAVHMYNVESRVAMVPATAFMRMGYMEDCTMVVVVPIGPCKERWYFNPGSGREDFRPFREERRGQILMYPPLWIRFTGPGQDQGRRGIKTKDEWWKQPYTRLDIVEDEEWGKFIMDRNYAVFAAADEIRKKRKVRRLNLPKIKQALDAKK